MGKGVRVGVGVGRSRGSLVEGGHVIKIIILVLIMAIQKDEDQTNKPFYPKQTKHHRH